MAVTFAIPALSPPSNFPDRSTLRGGSEAAVSMMQGTGFNVWLVLGLRAPASLRAKSERFLSHSSISSALP